MKRKNGFTLIELLAVIVILAIIALIATPIVLNIIKDTKDSATLQSAQFYIDAVEHSIVNYNMTGKEFNLDVCSVNNGKLYCNGELLEVSIKGEKPDDGSIITFNNGKIDRVKLLYGDKIIVDNEKDVLVYGEDIEILPAGLYDDNNALLASWDQLVNTYGLDLETNYTLSTYKTSGSMYAVLNTNPDLSLATKVIVENGVETIGNYSFYGCQNLKSITLPDSVTSIGNYAFTKNTLLENFIIPSNVMKIGNYAFNQCDSLQQINIPEGVIEIGQMAFYSCDSLKKVTLPNSLTSIGRSVFQMSENLEEVILPNSLISIGERAFSGTSLKEINIPNSVTSIGNYAFWGTNLKEIKISNNVTSVGVGICAKCANLEKIAVDFNNNLYSDYDNSNIIVEVASNKLIMGSKNITTIPEGIKSIGSEAFYGLGLKKINLSDSVTIIGSEAFAYNDILEINLSNNVTTIDSGAFDYNVNLKELFIPKGVTSIGYSLVNGCDSLEKIIVEEGNPYYDSRDNSNAIINTSANTLLAGCKNSIIPNTVVSIHDYAFKNIHTLTSIIIPDSVKSIKYQAFGDTGLKSIVLPDSLTSLGMAVFWGCKDLETVTISKNVNSIYGDMFQGSTNIKTIYYKGTATGAPWGASNATVISNY